jgi:chromosome segregation ATPase
MDAKTRISGAQEIQRIIAVRLKEIGTLMSRTTITAGEKTKLTNEESEIKGKMEAQQNIVDTETKNLVSYETSLTTLATTIKTFKGYVAEIKTVVKDLEKKVTETKNALKAPKKKDDSAPPVKGKDTEEKDAEEKDEDGDDKIDDVDEEVDEKESVKGGNEKVDKELDQVEEENKSTTTQIDSLTKTITTVEEKSEIADKEVIQEIADTTKEEAAIAETKRE